MKELEAAISEAKAELVSALSDSRPNDILGQDLGPYRRDIVED